MADRTSNVETVDTAQGWHWSTREVLGTSVAVLCGAILMVLSHLILTSFS